MPGRPIYLYGISPSSNSSWHRDVTGVAGAPVRLITDGAVAAIVSELPEAEYRAKRRDLMAHSDVLQAAIADGDVLPMRFGTTFEDEAELRSGLLEPNRETLTGMLSRLAGKVEVQVKATYVEASVVAAIVEGDRAIARLRSRKDLESQVELGRRFADALDRKRNADGGAIVKRLSGSSSEYELGDAPGDYGVVNVSFLIDRDEIERFDEVVERLRSDVSEMMTVRYLGPLPPYSFVDTSALRTATWV
jgi:hypothetical protein